MGMIHDDGDTLNVARIFQERVLSGEFVRVGHDRALNPLYMEAETVAGRSFFGLDAAASRALNAFLRVHARKGGVK